MGNGDSPNSTLATQFSTMEAGRGAPTAPGGVAPKVRSYKGSSLLFICQILVK